MTFLVDCRLPVTAYRSQDGPHRVRLEPCCGFAARSSQLAARRIGPTESGWNLVVALCSSQLALAARSIDPIDQQGVKSFFAACSCRTLPEGVVKLRVRPIHSSLCTSEISSCTLVSLLARGILGHISPSSRVLAGSFRHPGPHPGCAHRVGRCMRGTPRSASMAWHAVRLLRTRNRRTQRPL